MAINRIGSDLARPAGGDVRDPGSSKQPEGEGPRRVERSDRVDISAEGRDLAARLQQQTEGAAVDRSAEIRDRIQSGYYNDPAIAERVAQRLWSSGDLEATALGAGSRRVN